MRPGDKTRTPVQVSIMPAWEGSPIHRTIDFGSSAETSTPCQTLSLSHHTAGRELG
jgi:hypothetical protein